MKNKFIVIIPTYNVIDWIDINFQMLNKQSYDNYKVVYIDDHSSDGTYEHLLKLTENLDNFFVIRTEEKSSGQGNAYFTGIDFLKDNNLIFDEDVIVEVDSDDWLSSTFVLQYLNNIYELPDIWMTYGHYQQYPSGEIGGHYEMEILDEVDSSNVHRKYPFPYSHLKTYKFFLLNRIDKNDLTDPDTGKLYNAAFDHNLCLPMVEMAGKKHIHRVDGDILYILNRSETLDNEGSSRLKEQKLIESKIRSNRVYDRIERNKITCELKGPGNLGVHNFGLGNQLFQIATTLSLALDNDLEAVFPDLQLSSFGTYCNNIFRKLNISGDKSFVRDVYKDRGFLYSAIPIKDNISIDGYFQSEKYFKHNRNFILKQFALSADALTYIREKYSNVIECENSVSCHVRRGDYVNVSHMHTLLSETDYYKRAFKEFSNHTFFIFSDDIEWCKNNFNDDNFIFIEREEDYIDLYLMSMCRHHIIANSSFSWWGAWLNTNENKRVIAPKQWFGPARNLSDDDIIPSEWKRI